MTFIPLDDKNECIGFYKDRQLHIGQLPTTDCGPTWKYAPALNNVQTEYAHLYVNGKDMSDVCPESLKEEWNTLNSKAKSFVRSFLESKVSLKDNCFYDLVPRSFLIDYFDIKCQIVDHVIKYNPKPHDYNFKLDLERLLTDIKYHNIKLNKQNLKNLHYDQKLQTFVNNYCSKDNTIIYNQFNSRTGRLTTEENSFPVLNLNRQYRIAIEPNNDMFLELDYNAAEVRTFLALSGIKQPTDDIHDWNRKVFNYPDRKSAKDDFISWMYGKKNEREKDFKKLYDIDKLKNKHWDGHKIKNYYGRIIDSDQFHSINYLVQSTTADIVLRQAIKLYNLLQKHNSYIAMIIHDSIVIDLKKEEKSIIKDIIDMYTNTDLGKFKTSVKIGKNLGEMRKIL